MSARILLIILTSAFSITAQAQLRANIPYVCSDGQIYSVRAKPFPLAGIGMRGILQSFQAFCKDALISTADCQADRSSATMRCFKEFQNHGNLLRHSGKWSIIPGRFRHSPSNGLLRRAMFASSKDLPHTCKMAVTSLGCLGSPRKTTPGSQLMCVYNRSSYNNRSLGRNCFSIMNSRLENSARVYINSSGQRSVAGR